MVQPSVIWIGDAEKMFYKKVPKEEKEVSKRNLTTENLTIPCHFMYLIQCSPFGLSSLSPVFSVRAKAPEERSPKDPQVHQRRRSCSSHRNNMQSYECRCQDAVQSIQQNHPDSQARLQLKIRYKHTSAYTVYSCNPLLVGVTYDL